jgi:hypothetical protein
LCRRFDICAGAGIGSWYVNHGDGYGGGWGVGRLDDRDADIGDIGGRGDRYVCRDRGWDREDRGSDSIGYLQAPHLSISRRCLQSPFFRFHFQNLLQLHFQKKRCGAI